MKSICPNLKFLDKKVLVLGFSKSGISAAKYLNSQGADVYITEYRDEKPEDAEKLKELKAFFKKCLIFGLLVCILSILD